MARVAINELAYALSIGNSVDDFEWSWTAVIRL